MQNLSCFWSDFKKNLMEASENLVSKHWLTDIEFLNISEKEGFYKLQLKVPSELHKKWFQDHYLEKTRQCFKSLYHGTLKIELKASPNSSLQSLPYSTPFSPSQPQKPEKSQNFIFNPLYSFENFIPGTCSELAYQSALAVARSKSASATMNPLFIYGPSGLGKTHLLNAIGQESLKHFPQRKLLYLSGERFLNEYVAAIQNKKIQAFRDKFRKNHQLLLIDDVHILARGPGVQEEFFHTFNELYNKGIQVVICSDQAPYYIPSLEERIKTRLAGGLMADISYPDFETRLAILKDKIERKQLFLSQESLKLISQNCQSSIREMEGLLNKLKMMTEMNGGQLRFSDLEKILQAYKKELSLLDIKKKVALLFKISIKEMDSPSRKKQILKARQTAMYLSRKLLNKSLNDICQLFNRKDHTTVINAVKRVESYLKEDREFKSLFQLLEHELEKEFQNFF